MNDQIKLLYNSTFIFKNFNFVIEAMQIDFNICELYLRTNLY